MTSLRHLFSNSFQACNNYKLFDGKRAEADLKSLQDALNRAPIENDLVNHNIVVFRDGEGALQVLYGDQCDLCWPVLKPVFRAYKPRFWNSEWIGLDMSNSPTECNWLVGIATDDWYSARSSHESGYLPPETGGWVLWRNSNTKLFQLMQILAFICCCDRVLQLLVHTIFLCKSDMLHWTEQRSKKRTIWWRLSNQQLPRST